jgi:hypothetical protein
LEAIHSHFYVYFMNSWHLLVLSPIKSDFNSAIIVPHDLHKHVDNEVTFSIFVPKFAENVIFVELKEISSLGMLTIDVSMQVNVEVFLCLTGTSRSQINNFVHIKPRYRISKTVGIETSLRLDTTLHGNTLTGRCLVVRYSE